MGKYSKQLINSYLLGEEVEGVDFEKLENDTDFMIAVIDQSSDKEMVFYAGDKVKNDRNFVRFLITKFHNEGDFIQEIAKKYEKTLSEEDECKLFEMNILLEKAFYGVPDQEDTFASYRIVNMANTIKHLCAFEEPKFIDIEHYYKGYDLIIEYMAKEFLMDIFDKQLSPLEDYLHKILSSKENINPSNVVNTILNIIKSIDEELYWYIAKHIKLLDGLKNLFISYYNRWDYYFKNYVEDRIDILREVIDELLQLNYTYTTYNSHNLTHYVIKLFKEKYCHNPELQKVLYYDEEEVETMEYFLGEEISLIDQTNINKALEMAKKIFIYNDEYPEIDNPNNNKEKSGDIIDINDARPSIK